MSTRDSLLLAVILLGAAPGCAAPKPEPELASSAGHSHYARDFPEKLQAVTKDFGTRRAEARKIMGEMNGYPSKLKEPVSFAHVLQIVERADEDGHSFAYVDRLRRVQSASLFFEAEVDEINKKVAGSVAYTAKKKGCDEAIAGATGPALKDGVEKQLEKELHEGSEAHRLIDRYRGELGKENAALLEKQADDISRASYLVYVEIVEDKQRIVRMVGEAADVRRTLDEAVTAERAYLSEYKKMTEPEKKAVEARIADLGKSKAALDAAIQQAEAVVPTIEDEVKKIQKEYDDAVAALKSKIKDKVR
jgi:hypothetical protein